MNDELRQQLSNELPSNVPFTLDVEKTITAGRRRKQRRRTLFVTTATSTVAAVAALAFGFGTVIVPGADGPPAADGGPRSDQAGSTSAAPSEESLEAPTVAPQDGKQKYVLPEVDPDADYEWIFAHKPVSTSQQTREHTRALTKAMDQVYPGYELSTDNSELEFVRGEIGLHKGSDEDSKKVYQQPIYFTGAGSTSEKSVTAMPVRFPNSQQEELLHVSVWPAAEYQEKFDDTGAALFECAHSGAEISAACADNTLDGQRIQYQETERRINGDLVERQHRTVLYRDDGTVVIIENTINLETTSADTDLGAAKPTMLLPDQQKLAASMSHASVQ